MGNDLLFKWQILEILGLYRKHKISRIPPLTRCKLTKNGIEKHWKIVLICEQRICSDIYILKFDKVWYLNINNNECISKYDMVLAICYKNYWQEYIWNSNLTGKQKKEYEVIRDGNTKSHKHAKECSKPVVTGKSKLKFQWVIVFPYGSSVAQ